MKDEERKYNAIFRTEPFNLITADAAEILHFQVKSAIQNGYSGNDQGSVPRFRVWLSL
jgi:hypothetical protein